ncbi:hypothetical protein Bca4012_007772 [Brassica carinata]
MVFTFTAFINYIDCCLMSLWMSLTIKFMVQWRAILASSLVVQRRKTQQSCDYGQNVGEDAVIVLVNSVAENTQCTFEVMFGLL